MPSTPGMSRPVPYSSAGPSRKSSSRSRAPASPGCQVLARPALQSGRAGEQPPAVKRVAGREPSLRVHRRGREALRGVQGEPGLRSIQAGPPEGREDLVRPARPGPHRPRLKHQVRLEAGSRQALFRGPGLDAGVHLAFGAAVAAVPEQRRGAGFQGEVPDDARGRPAAQQQARARGLQPGGEVRQRMVQPPFRGAAEGPHAGGGLVEDIDHGQRLSQRRRFAQGRVVVQPEIVAEPDKGRRQGSRRHGSTVHAALHLCRTAAPPRGTTEAGPADRRWTVRARPLPVRLLNVPAETRRGMPRACRSRLRRRWSRRRGLRRRQWRRGSRRTSARRAGPRSRSARRGPPAS